MNKHLLLVLLFLLFVPVATALCEEGERRQCGETNQGECSFGVQVCDFGQ